MKIIFAGTPTFASIILEGLIKEGLKPSCVLTQPDRGKGRGRKVIISPVKKVAIDSEIEVLQPLTLKDRAIQSKIEIMAPDLLVVAAYGLILPREILCTPKFGCINVHASVLPRWRGAAPIERAILAGDQTTGISIMQMEEGQGLFILTIYPLNARLKSLHYFRWLSRENCGKKWWQKL